MPVIHDRADERSRTEYWRKVVSPFRGGDTRRSVLQLTTTVVLFVSMWAAMFYSLKVSYLLTLLFALPTAGFMLRLFMIQHDCGHGSFFRQRRARDWIGFCIGVLTLTPYRYWRRTHAHHHAHSGNLDMKSFGDITTMTVRDYQALPRLRRLAYRLYRNPVILLGIGPAYQFLIKHRYPWDAPRCWKKEWKSVWWTNLCLLGIIVLMAKTIGLSRFLLIQGPVTFLTCAIGVWLFYVQHQFENTYWDRKGDWDFFDAVLQGSSHLVLPKPLRWFTASIGLHHVHHLSSLIPNYKLQACLDANRALQASTRIRIKDTWKLLRLTLWNEEARRLIGFADLPRHRGALE